MAPSSRAASGDRTSRASPTLGCRWYRSLTPMSTGREARPGAEHRSCAGPSATSMHAITTTRVGLGTYDHEPHAVEAATLRSEAEQPWPGELFDPAVDAGLQLLPARGCFRPERRLNGLFSM